MLLVTSVSLDPFWNLAVEDHLLDLVAVQGPTLFIWQSHDTVVVGKNQNPWRESHGCFLREHEIQLARRISGGGAVYHDTGNLNYAFFCARDRYREAEVYEALMGGLRGLGIQSERLGKSSLAVAGKKVSGNAFCHRRNGVMQHGTLLVASNLERLQGSLVPGLENLDTHAIASEPAEVANLSELDVRWNLEQVGQGVVAGFEERFGAVDTRQCSDDLHPEHMQELHQRFCSIAWRFGKTPRFQVRLQAPPFDVTVQVHQGRIRDVAIAAGGDLAWEEAVGAWFLPENLAAAIAPPDQRREVEGRFGKLGM